MSKAVEKLSMNGSRLRQLLTAIDSRAHGSPGHPQSSDRRMTAGQHATNTFSTPFNTVAARLKDRRREDLPASDCRLSTLRRQVITTATNNSLNR